MHLDIELLLVYKYECVFILVVSILRRLTQIRPNVWRVMTKRGEWGGQVFLFCFFGVYRRKINQQINRNRIIKIISKSVYNHLGGEFFLVKWVMGFNEYLQP